MPSTQAQWRMADLVITYLSAAPALDSGVQRGRALPSISQNTAAALNFALAHDVIQAAARDADTMRDKQAIIRGTWDISGPSGGLISGTLLVSCQTHRRTP